MNLQCVIANAGSSDPVVAQVFAPRYKAAVVEISELQQHHGRVQLAGRQAALALVGEKRSVLLGLIKVIEDKKVSEPAVLASEVLSLAGRSAQAAREIKSLIHASVERVEQGTAFVDQAGTTMAEWSAASDV